MTDTKDDVNEGAPGLIYVIAAFTDCNGDCESTGSASVDFSFFFLKKKTERGGQIYRSNVRGEAGHHHIGKIDAILAGKYRTCPRPRKNDSNLAGQCRSLKIDDINDYTLRTSPGGGVFCDVFWDQSSQAIGGEITGTLSPAVADSGDAVNQGPSGQHSWGSGRCQESLFRDPRFRRIALASFHSLDPDYIRTSIPLFPLVLIPPFLLRINTDRTCLFTSFNQLRQYLIAEFISDSLRLVLPTPVCFLSVSPLGLGSHSRAHF
jgi:hypothetical protein